MVLTVHHLHVSQSERIPWLCEELGIDYGLKLYKRAPVLAPPEYKALHHSKAAPVIQDGDLTLAESGACVEYICRKYGDGRLYLDPTHPEYADFLYWWHWSNGSFQPALGRAMMWNMAGLSAADNVMASVTKERLKGGLEVLDKRLASNEWLAGTEFTAADVMLVFSLTTFRYFHPFSLGEYTGVLGYFERISRRPAYQRAMKKSDPDMELALGPDPPKKAWT